MATRTKLPTAPRGAPMVHLGTAAMRRQLATQPAKPVIGPAPETGPGIQTLTPPTETYPQGAPISAAGGARQVISEPSAIIALKDVPRGVHVYATLDEYGARQPETIEISHPGKTLTGPFNKIARRFDDGGFITGDPGTLPNQSSDPAFSAAPGATTGGSGGFIPGDTGGLQNQSSGPGFSASMGSAYADQTSSAFGVPQQGQADAYGNVMQNGVLTDPNTGNTFQNGSWTSPQGGTFDPANGSWSGNTPAPSQPAATGPASGFGAPGPGLPDQSSDPGFSAPAAAAVAPVPDNGFGAPGPGLPVQNTNNPPDLGAQLQSQPQGAEARGTTTTGSMASFQPAAAISPPDVGGSGIRGGTAAAAGTAASSSANGGGSVSPDRAAFYSTYSPAVKDIEKRTGIPAAIALGLLGSESGFNGRLGSGYSLTGEAYVGQAGAHGEKHQSAGAGDPITLAVFDTPEQALASFERNLQSSRYAGALANYKQSGDEHQYALDVANAGYMGGTAADKANWANMISGLAQGARQYASGGKITIQGAPAYDDGGEVAYGEASGSGEGSGATAVSLQHEYGPTTLTWDEYQTALRHQQHPSYFQHPNEGSDTWGMSADDPGWGETQHYAGGGFLEGDPGSLVNQSSQAERDRLGIAPPMPAPEPQGPAPTAGPGAPALPGPIASPAASGPTAASDAQYGATQGSFDARAGAIAAQGGVTAATGQQLDARGNLIGAQTQQLGQQSAYYAELARAAAQNQTMEESRQAAQGNVPGLQRYAFNQMKQNAGDEMYKATGTPVPTKIVLPPGYAGPDSGAGWETQNETPEAVAARAEENTGKTNSNKAAVLDARTKMSGLDVSRAQLGVDSSTIGVDRARMGADTANQASSAAALAEDRTKSAPSSGLVWNASTQDWVTPAQNDAINAQSGQVWDAINNTYVTRTQLAGNTYIPPGSTPSQAWHLRTGDGVWVDADGNEFRNGAVTDPKTGNTYDKASNTWHNPKDGSYAVQSGASGWVWFSADGQNRFEGGQWVPIHGAGGGGPPPL